MSYYYLIASLPALELDTPPALTPEAFLELCGEHLSASDLASVRAVMRDRPSPGRFTAAWRDRETQLRNAVARLRAARAGRDPAPFLRPARGFDPALDRRAAEAFSRPTPREREHALDALRWDQAETLAGLDPFAVDALLGYAVKLRLARRWADMDRETGEQRAEAVVAAREPAAERATARTGEGAAEL